MNHLKRLGVLLVCLVGTCSVDTTKLIARWTPDWEPVPQAESVISLGAEG